jgi:hypothetical protein
VKPSHGKPDEIPAQDNRTWEQMEQREALLQILEMGQGDIDAGNFCDAAGFFDERDGKDADD